MKCQHMTCHQCEDEQVVKLKAERETEAKWAESWKNLATEGLNRKDDLKAELAAMTKRAEEAERKLEHSDYWYGCRFERLREWAKTLPEVECHRYFSIVANGTAETYEPPTYAQQYNVMQYERDEALKLLREVVNAHNDQWLGDDSCLDANEELFGRVMEALGVVEEPENQSPLCKCGHSQDSHDDFGSSECYHNDSPSGGTGCCCPKFQLKE
jgi:hypothetical protein